MAPLPGTTRNVEIGIGGDLTGLRGRPDGRSFSGDFRAQLAHLDELIHAYDPAARIEFIEGRPPEDRAEELGEVAAEMGIPLKQFTAIYYVGGAPGQPDALDLLKTNLALARRVGTVDRLNMQVVGDNSTPTTPALLLFYARAEEMAQAAGIELYTETHVDRFTYDPRRLVDVHDALLNYTGGRFGLRVCGDLSHYVHQNGNPHFPNWSDISSGELNLDPLDPSNYISNNVIQTGLIGYGHLRMAVPNSIPPGEGSIQYPVVDPRTDPETAHTENGGLPEPWDEEKTRPWWAWYREVFAYQQQHLERPVARFSTEFIGDGTAGHYRVHPYRNLFQNVAMVAKAQRMLWEIVAGA
jgi:hypothetical protein